MKRLIVSFALAVVLATNTGCGVLDFLLLGNHGCGPRTGPGCGDECGPGGGFGAGAHYQDECCPCPLDNLFHGLLYGCCSRDGCGCDDCGGGECMGGRGGCPDDCCNGPLGLGLGGCLRDLWCNLGCCGGGCGECYYGEHRDEPSARCEPCDCNGNFTGPGYGSYFPRHRRGHGGGVVETEGEVIYETVPAGAPRRASPIPTRPIPASPEAYYSPRTTRSAARFETRPRNKGSHRAYRQVNYDSEPQTTGFTPRHEEESGWQPRVHRNEE